MRVPETIFLQWLGDYDPDMPAALLLTLLYLFYDLMLHPLPR